VMSIPDKAMPIYHKLLLGWLPQQMAELEAGLKDGSLHPNEVKMNLARQLVAIFHSPEAAEGAQKRWDDVFRSKDKDAVPDDIPEEKLPSAKKVVDILRDLKMVASGQEAKQLIKGGGIRVNGDAIEDQFAQVTPEMLPVVLQVGKRKFVRLVQ
jgi:tyrosyl-tRNA synthetase